MTVYSNRDYLGLAFGIIMCIFFLYSGITKEKIESPNDLTQIKGTFSKYSFQDGTGYKRQGREYYFWMGSYGNAFQISAEYLGIFDEDEFMVKLRPGDEMTITIPKRLYGAVDTDEIIFVTSIQVGKDTYLDKDKVLKIEKKLADSNTEFYAAGVALILGFVLFIKGR